MSRCLACDVILSESELLAKRTLTDGTKEPWDTCNTCKQYVRDPDYDTSPDPTIQNIIGAR